MRTAPLDELYFTWLYEQVASVKVSNPSKTYWRLLRILHQTEFFWRIPNDVNRAEDGRDLRKEFVEKERVRNPDRGWEDLGCSVLELVVALSRRLSFEVDGEPRDWFWVLMVNLELNRFTDNADFQDWMVRRVLDDLIWRRYESDGKGGLFPLRDPDEDQRDVELWYQMQSYLLEM